MSDDETTRRLRRQAARDGRLQKALAAALAAAVLGFVVLFYLPSLRRTAALDARITTDAATLGQAGRRADRLPRVRAAADDLASHLGAFKPVPREAGEAAFLRSISAAADRLRLRGLEFEPLSPPPGTAALSPRELPVRLAFEADFVDAFDFLRHVEEMPRLLRVRDVTLRSADDDDGAGGRVRAELTVSLFWDEG